MPVIQKTLEVPYNVAEMYELVNDINAYHDFIPGCTHSKIVKHDKDSIQAKLTLLGGESFTTRNRLKKNESVVISLIEGPFRDLKGFWRFEPTKQQGCRVLLNLEFEFRNRLLSIPFSFVFDKIVQSLVEAFLRRAKQVYGER